MYLGVDIGGYGSVGYKQMIEVASTLSRIGVEQLHKGKVHRHRVDNTLRYDAIEHLSGVVRGIGLEPTEIEANNLGRLFG